jgi:hypothetical protein
MVRVGGEVEAAEVERKAVVAEAEPEATRTAMSGVLEDEDGHGRRIGQSPRREPEGRS